MLKVYQTVPRVVILSWQCDKRELQSFIFTNKNTWRNTECCLLSLAPPEQGQRDIKGKSLEEPVSSCLMFIKHNLETIRLEKTALLLLYPGISCMPSEQLKELCRAKLSSWAVSCLLHERGFWVSSRKRPFVELKGSSGIDSNRASFLQYKHTSLEILAR